MHDSHHSLPLRPVRGIHTVVGTGDVVESIEMRVAVWMATNGILLTRLALGFVFLWFGALKFAHGASEAEDVAKRTLVTLTFGHVPSEVCVYVLAVWECLIGLGLLSGRLLGGTLILLFLQLSGTFLPLFFLSFGDLEAVSLRANARRTIHH